MKKRFLSGLLVFALVLQALIPSIAYANKNNTEKKTSNNNLITIGKLSKKDYPEIDPSTLLRVAKKERNKLNGKAMEKGATLFSAKSPYIKGQQPADPDKPKYWANVEGKLTTVGIDGGTFDWNKIFGQGAKVKLLFTQTNGNVMTGITYTLLVDKDGTYTWQGSDNKPTYLPLYDVDGNPYTYNVQIERNYSKNVQLIIQESNGTPKAKFRQEGDKQVATISFLDIAIQQVASTKFVSEWHTGVDETKRPQIEGYFEADTDVDNNFNFPKNDTTRTVLRSSFLENFVEDEDNGPWSFLSSELEKTPKTVKVKTDTQGLTFEEKGGVKIVKSGDHKFKYDFKYDVIDGGKLTMTEILPVTFDANGGKFANFTAPDTETKIVKEVDYDGTLTDKAETPKKDRETFKGWGIKDAQGTIIPVTDDAFKNIKEAKTFYAIWDNNDIVADQLEVKESFKDGTGYVNDFIPNLAKLKGQVKIKNANGDAQALETTDTFEILNDSGDAITGDALKDYLYKKLQEKANPKDEPTRVETVKAKVTRDDGNIQKVDIPIKVIKNIYEAKTLTEKPYYVPDGYVKVTLDPTTKAKDPQKTYYYVNPEAKVVIPGKDPEGTGDNTFVKWIIKGSTEEYKLAEKPRHKFSGETTIEAQYISDVIPANDDGSKPDTVPANFVEVKFVPTDKATDETKAEKIFWVNPDKEVDLTDKAPKVVANAEYKHTGWDKALKDTFKNATVITAQYKKKVETTDPNDTENYIKVTFKSEANGKLAGDKTEKSYWVLKDTPVTLTEPTVTANKGYKFIKYDPEVQTSYSKDTEHKAKYKKVIETKDPKDKDYVKVSFDAAKQGKIKADSNAEVWVLKGETIDPEAIIPELDIKEGYAFKAWTPEVLNKYSEDTKHTASYTYNGDNVVPQKPGEDKPNVPANFVRVIFIAGDHGSIANTETNIFWVNPEKQVTLTAPNLVANKGYKHMAWTYGTKEESNLNSVTDTFTEKETTITAKYLEKILTEDPKDKENYVKVDFKADADDQSPARGSLKGTTTYWVLKNTDVNIDGPKVSPNSGYSFTEWSPAIKTKYNVDTTHTAQYTSKDKVLTQDPKDSDYIKVIFNANGGKIGLDNSKDLWVLKGIATFADAKAKVAGPTKVNSTFKGWQDKVSEGNPIEDTKVLNNNGETFYAAWFDKGKIIEDPTSETPDPDYVRLTFDATAEGKIVDTGKTSKVIDVLKGTPYTDKDLKDVIGKIKAVPNNAEKAFDKWTPAVPTTGFVDTAIFVASYADYKNIIPYDPSVSDPMARPEGYVKVTFKAENGLKLTEQKAYYVKKNAGVTLKELVKPKYDETTGYKFENWDKQDTDEIKDKDIIVTAKAKKLDDVIPKTKEDDSEKPDGYITVTFDKGANGELEGKTIFYVNPNKAVVLEDKAPTIKPNTGYTSAGWDTTINKAIQYKDGDKITALYNELGDVIPQEKTDGTDKPAGYLTVTFDKGEHGELSGKTVYYVKPNKEVTVPAPTVTPSVGFEFEKWDKELTQTFKEDTTITAQYKKSTGTTPGTNPDQPGDNPGGTTPGTNPETPGENPDQPGTVPENPGAIPGTKSGVVEKHGNRYVERVAGKNRVHTAISTSKRFFKKSKYVIIADSGNYPDALTATVLAHVLDCPILLNNTRYLEDDVAREIVRLGASEVIIVGGHKSISENVKSQLGKFDANKVQRIWGRDRYVTSSELAYEIERLTGKVNKAIIASGENFPDALATAPLGSKEIAPILLVTRNQMDKKVSKALKDLNINKVYVAGGQNSVSKKLEAQLPQVIRRFSGQDRYETAILVASYTYPESKEVFVASGETFPDALVIGPVCARRKAPILLSKSTPVKVTDDYIEKSKIEYLYIIGGTNTIHVDTAHKYAIED